ncbi:hypothetical protein V6N12_074644 [Hibiscus sabdariffa]|uniref:Secreted protein n=1 Tax=Hibiscus sabdariffa TaxID=183260 RepID=A0ABR2BY11_9ROSI
MVAFRHGLCLWLPLSFDIVVYVLPAPVLCGRYMAMAWTMINFDSLVDFSVISNALWLISYLNGCLYLCDFSTVDEAYAVDSRANNCILLKLSRSLTAIYVDVGGRQQHYRSGLGAHDGSFRCNEICSMIRLSPLNSLMPELSVTWIHTGG